jgi:hypothetical protein
MTSTPIKENEMGRACGIYGDEGNTHRVLVRKHE